MQIIGIAFTLFAVLFSKKKFLIILFLKKSFCIQMTISAPPGQPIGYVKQRCSCIKANFDILDENEQCVLSIEGPCCTCKICGDVEFEVNFNLYLLNIRRL